MKSVEVIRKGNFPRSDKVHSIVCLSRSSENIDNYVMIPIEKVGYIVIKQEIEVNKSEN